MNLTKRKSGTTVNDKQRTKNPMTYFMLVRTGFIVTWLIYVWDKFCVETYNICHAIQFSR